MEEKVEIVWSESALIMLAELQEYISQESEVSADNYVDVIHASLNKLEKHPESCSICRDKKLAKKGYRCCKYKNHITIYFFAENEVRILAIIHSSRSSETIEKVLK